MKNLDPHALFCVVLSAAASALSAQPTWIAEIKGSGWDSMYDMAMDANGNAVVCGRFEGTTDFDPTAGVFNLTSAGAFDGFVAKYDVNGNLLWAGRIGGVEMDLLQALAVDDVGSVALYGWFEGTADLDPGTGTQSTVSAGLRDGCVLKLDPNGNLLWAFALNNATQCYEGDIDFSPLNGDVVVTGCYETSIDLDPNGSFVLNADLDGIVEENTIFMARYDGSGDLLWGHKLAGLAYPHVDLHASGGTEVINWCVSGVDQSTAPSDLDPGPGFVQPVSGSDGNPMHLMAVAQFDANGNYLWSDAMATYFSAPGSNPPDVHVWSFRTGADGSIWIGGSIHLDYSTYAANQASISHIALGRDGFALKYSGTGTLLWEKVVGGPQIQNTEFVGDVNIDGDGNIWLTTGLTTGADLDIGGSPVILGSTQQTDIVLVKYDASGNYLWHGTGGGDWHDSPQRLAFFNGDAVLAGSYATNGGTADLDFSSGTTALTAIGLYDGFITRFSTDLTTSVVHATSHAAFVAWPNPCDDVLFVNTNGPFEVRDLAGRALLSGQLHNGRLSTVGLAPGAYCLVLGGTGDKRTMRFVRQ